ncbi:MAG: penicillin-insensitive murein endopeptidase [Geminicoccaceae bacterium]
MRARAVPEVERIFVHPGIKQALCAQAGGDHAWLAKVRPRYGHDAHFHAPRLLAGRSARLPGAGAAARDGQVPSLPGGWARNRGALDHAAGTLAAGRICRRSAPVPGRSSRQIPLTMTWKT